MSSTHVDRAMANRSGWATVRPAALPGSLLLGAWVLVGIQSGAVTMVIVLGRSSVPAEPLWQDAGGLLLWSMVTTWAYAPRWGVFRRTFFRPGSIAGCATAGCGPLTAIAMLFLLAGRMSLWASGVVALASIGVIGWEMRPRRLGALFSAFRASKLDRARLPSHIPDLPDDCDVIASTSTSEAPDAASRESRHDQADGSPWVALDDGEMHLVDDLLSDADGETSTVRQRWLRYEEAEGERVVGFLTVEVPQGQQTAWAHLPFWPPLASEPSGTWSIEDRSDLRLKLAESRPYGLRWEIRLSRPSPLQDHFRLSFDLRAAIPSM